MSGFWGGLGIGWLLFARGGRRRKVRYVDAETFDKLKAVPSITQIDSTTLMYDPSGETTSSAFLDSTTSFLY